MKILVLTPFNKSGAMLCTKIWEQLSPDIQKIGFSIPMYMQYLIETKQAEGLPEAYFYSMKAAELVYNQSSKDLIMFGNMNADFEFDVVFNLREDDREFFVEALGEIVGDESELLSHFLTNQHTGKESVLKLKGIDETAKFLNTYLHTKVQDELDKLIFEYHKQVKDIEANGKASKITKQVS